MKIVRSLLCALPLAFWGPAWAIHKCTDAGGKVSFQDAPCVGEGEEIQVRPAMEGATPTQPPPSSAPPKEGPFGATWQRKQYLQTQGLPQARAALEKHERECGAPPAEAVARTAPLRLTLGSGSQYAQEQEGAAAKQKADCEARAQDLRNKVRVLEDELRTR